MDPIYTNFLVRGHFRDLNSSIGAVTRMQDWVDCGLREDPGIVDEPSKDLIAQIGMTHPYLTRAAYFSFSYQIAMFMYVTDVA